MAAPAEAPKPHIPYQITGQEKTQTLTPGGVFTDVWRVMFVTDNGTHSYIEVPLNEYTPGNVDRIIENELENIVGVHELGPEPHPENAAE